MFEIFWSNDFDLRVFLVRDNREYTVADVKKLVTQKAETLEKTKQTVFSGEDNFDFIISFFAAVFPGKEIFL